jgi:hypothetical protein
LRERETQRLRKWEKRKIKTGSGEREEDGGETQIDKRRQI